MMFVVAVLRLSDLRRSLGAGSWDDLHPCDKGAVAVDAKPLPDQIAKDAGAYAEVSDEMQQLLRSLPQKQFRFRKGVVDPLRLQGALDLYAGVGGVGRALIRGGAPWVFSFELKRFAAEDLLDKKNQDLVITLIVRGAVRVCGSALVCASFSMAVTPPIRSPTYPRGVPWASAAARERLKDGNEMADFNVKIHDACEHAEPEVWYWTENPDGSHPWRQKGYEKFKKPSSKDVLRADFCRFGTPWRKRTRVATNVLPLGGLRLLCRCKKSHLRLRGQHPVLHIPWTLVAQP